jgi:hypothetical protein
VQHVRGDADVEEALDPPGAVHLVLRDEGARVCGAGGGGGKEGVCVWGGGEGQPCC